MSLDDFITPQGQVNMELAQAAVMSRLENDPVRFSCAALKPVTVEEAIHAED